MSIQESRLATLAALRQLVEGNKSKVALAAKYLEGEMDACERAWLADRRRAAEDRLACLTQVHDLILQGFQNAGRAPSQDEGILSPWTTSHLVELARSWGDVWEGRVEDYVATFQAAHGGGLDIRALSPLEAYVEGSVLQELGEEEGCRPTASQEADEFRKLMRGPLDPSEIRESGRGRELAFGVVLRRRVVEGAHLRRNSSEWWLIAVASLIALDQRFDASEIGIDGLPGWTQEGSTRRPPQRDALVRATCPKGWTPDQVRRSLWGLAEGARAELETELPKEDEAPGCSKKAKWTEDDHFRAIAVVAKYRGITIRKLAEKTGIPRTTLSGWSDVNKAMKLGAETEVVEPRRGFMSGTGDDAFVEGIDERTPDTYLGD